MTSEVSVSSLPPGWRRVRLGDLAEDEEAFADGPFGSNLKTEHYSSEGARVIRLQNIGRGVFLDADKAFVPLGHFANLRRHSVEPGDVVIAALGDGARPAGRACVVPPGLGSAIVKADCFRIRLPRTLIVPEFLTGFLNSPQSLTRIALLMRGATRPRVTLETLKRLEIVLPAVTEQVRIVRAIGEATQEVERVRSAAEVQIEAARSLSGSYLRQAFETPEARAWPRMRLGDLLAAPLKTGISRAATPSSSKRCLTLSAVRNGTLDLAANKPADVSDLEALGNWVLPGAFYVVRGNGNRSLVGRGGFAPRAIEPNVLFPDLLIQVIADRQVVMPEYLRFTWDSGEVRRDLESRARTAAGIYKISQGNLAEVKVPIPSVAVQRQVAESLKRELALAEEAQTVIGEGVTRIAALPAALLRRAFAAEL